jgi:hypothetical protein
VTGRTLSWTGMERQFSETYHQNFLLPLAEGYHLTQLSKSGPKNPQKPVLHRKRNINDR